MVTTQKYEENKIRLQKAEIELEGKWNDPKYINWKNKYSEIMEENLEYEKVNGLW